MNKTSISEMMRVLVDEYKLNRQWGTAHVYQSALNAFAAFAGRRNLHFDDLSAHIVKDFEIFLRQRQCSWNTVATYMKALKATYNRAVEMGLAAYTPRLFANVRIAVTNCRKRALDAIEIAPLVATSATPPSPTLHQVKLVFALMFLLRGIPFVDLAFLRKDNIRNGYLSYRRRKTGRTLTVKLTAEATAIIKTLTADTPRKSPYLFPFINSQEGSLQAYNEYQRALRKLNHQLRKLSAAMNYTHLSTYTARHSWATMAYYCEIHQGIISEAMGHSSIAVTETYLKPFHNDRIDQANDTVIAYIKSSTKNK